MPIHSPATQSLAVRVSENTLVLLRKWFVNLAGTALLYQQPLSQFKNLTKERLTLQTKSKERNVIIYKMNTYFDMSCFLKEFVLQRREGREKEKH